MLICSDYFSDTILLLLLIQQYPVKLVKIPKKSYSYIESLTGVANEKES